MSIVTKFLKLFEYDPETDGASTFNIPKALNENWDKIDAWASGIKDTIAGLVPSTRKINKKPLSADVTLTGEDIKVTGSDDTTIHTRLSEITNPNLLDNWYFVGGGSQQGSGQFPINQRGNISVNKSSDFLIDRWNIYRYESGNATLTNSGLSLVGDFDFGERIESSRFPNTPNTIITISVLFIDGTLKSKTAVLTNTGEQEYIGLDIKPDATFTLIHNHAVKTDLFFFGLRNGAEINPIACKLELGSQQTLAHLENGKWVLNEIPDYGEQLARCQRYLLDITPNIPFNLSYIGSCVKDRVTFSIPTPVTLRAAPVFIGDATKIQIVFGDSESYIASNARTVVSGSGFCTILCTIAGDVAEGNRVCDFRKIDETARFLLSAEL